MRSTFFAMLVINLGFVVSLSQSYKFYVGGNDGWVLTPSEDYNHWAERNRFQVNDTLFFKYEKGADSVLVVNKDDYYSCNSKKPLESLSEGNSTFKFNRSGPFFFISGNADKCNKGQKLIIVVLALSHHHHHHHDAPQQAPSLPPTMSPSPSPSHHMPLPDSDIPALAPSPSKSSAGSIGFNGGSSFGRVVGATIGVSVMLGSFVGVLV